MRLVSCSLALALFTTACVAPDAADEASTTDELAAAPRAAFVLTVSSDESGIIVTKPDGTTNPCGDFQRCQFAYIAGTTVTVKPRTTRNNIDCVKFDHWTGACAGQGSTCTLAINSDLTTNAAWSFIPPPLCRPQ